MTGSSKLEEDRGMQGDDSPYLSIADFFSLISLTVIYLIIVFSPQSPVAQGAVITGVAVASGTGPASATDPELAYVALVAIGRDLAFRLVSPPSPTIIERTFPNSATGRTAALQYVEEQLGNVAEPSGAVLYLEGNEERAEVHKLFNDTVRVVSKRFRPVSVVFGDTD